MRILTIGGTRFIGRHFVERAISRNHSVTLFHRGQSTSSLFRQSTHVVGDRNNDLQLLADGSWDVTVDFSAFTPRQVRQLAVAIRSRSDQYMLVSSTAVYAPPEPYGFDEDAPRITLADPVPEEVTNDSYGGLKALCEDAAIQCFSDPLIIRPTYVVGPYDYTGRFTYWVNRIARGGDILAPGPTDAYFQLIDVRDLTEWMVSLLEQDITGTYHAATPFPPTSFGKLLDDIASCVAPSGTTFSWVDQSYLLNTRLEGAELPLWPGANPDGIIEAADPSRAKRTGLVTRPIIETIRQICDHELHSPTPVKTPVGLDAKREAELLASWRQRGGRVC